MVELDDIYKKDAGDSLVGNTHLIMGPALSGKSGYVFWKQSQSL